MVDLGAFDISGHYNLAGIRVAAWRIVYRHATRNIARDNPQPGRQAADPVLEARENALHLRHIAASVLPD